MKKILTIALTAILLAGMGQKANAQLPGDTLQVPYGGFEEWDNYPGDTMTLMGLPIPLYGEYSLPTGWKLPMLSINETFTDLGTPITINASVPVGMVRQDSVNQPQGSSALVARTFLFSELLSPVAYTFASSLLDSSILNSAIPTVVSNANIDVMKFLPLMDQLTNNTADMSWLLDMVDTLNLDDYIAGGFPLNGFEPKYLTGYFKYIDGDSGDNGAIVALGTYYDSLSHRRMLVGAGTKNLFQLYDSVDYERFQLEYFSLSSYYPADYSFVEADSMIIAIISSAGSKSPSLGSRLFIDSLQLIHADGSCGRIINIHEELIGYTWADIRWDNTLTPDRWQAEYGEEGFLQGHGTLVDLTDSALSLDDLQEGTTYGVYVRGLCGDSSQTSWSYFSFTTKRHEEPIGILNAQADNISIHPNPANGRCVLDMGGTAVSRMKVYSIEGRLLEERAVSSQREDVEFSHPGLYIIELITPQGSIYKKISNR